ncbi:hypothetical protein MHBO_002505 [Bonamia ostreae]|uniref:Uncharacterized protein n=1 Tax=Bonamia ostreae TaxID=126728 RepID=A0ABV2AND3_9EUKA
MNGFNEPLNISIRSNERVIVVSGAKPNDLIEFKANNLHFDKKTIDGIVYFYYFPEDGIYSVDILCNKTVIKNYRLIPARLREEFVDHRNNKINEKEENIWSFRIPFSNKKLNINFDNLRSSHLSEELHGHKTEETTDTQPLLSSK